MDLETDLEDYLKAPKNTKDTYKRSFARWKEIIGEDIETYLQNEPTPKKFKDDLKKYVETLKKEKITKNTLKVRLAPIRAFAAENGLLISKKNYARLFVNNEEEVYTEEIEDEAFTQAQAIEVYNKLAYPFKMVFMTLFCAGLRDGECLKLKVTDVKFEYDPVRICVPAAITKGNKERWVLVTRELGIKLKEWIDYLPEYIARKADKMKGEKAEKYKEAKGLTQKRDDTGLLFPMSVSNFSVGLARACLKLGLNKPGERSKYHPHSCRKSFRTIVGQYGNADAASSLMGHAKGLDKNYVRLKIEECVAPYQRAEPYLSLTSLQAEIEAVKDAQMKQMSERIALLEKIVEMDKARK